MRLALLIACLCLAGPAFAAKITVFAAASLKDALEETAREWEARSGDEVVMTFAGSSVLARQITQGAPVDLFVSANVAWMDELERAGDLEPGTRRTLLANRLVLLRHGRGGAPVDPADLPELLGDRRLATALLDAVPAGIYAAQALKSLGILEALRPRIAQTDNVRAAVTLAARGEVPFAIAYRTDAGASDDVSVAATFAAASHDPIVYPAALMRGRKEGATFLDWLASPSAFAIFERHGFGRP